MLLALLVLNSLLGVLCLVVARGERRSEALRRWGWGLLAYSVGLLITIPPAIPVGLRKVVGNALIALAPILTVDGLLRNTTVRFRWRWVNAAFAVTVLALIINHLRPVYSVLVDMVAPAPIANILYVFAAVVLIRRPPPDAKSASRFLSGILMFCVVVWTVRLLLIWASLGSSNDRGRADLTVALFAIAQMVIAVAATLGLMWVEVRIMQAALERLANDDALTGLPNRRATVERFREEAARAERRGRPFSIAVFDIDHFKKVNDTYGHAAGDEALKHVAAILSDSKRGVDVVGRIGGEEFVVILAEEAGDGAIAAAERFRVAVEQRPLNELAITISGGVATSPQDGTEWDALFGAADRRLYASKNGGRNRVTGPPTAQLIAQPA